MFSQYDAFINAFTWSTLNGVSSRCFLNLINKYNCLMPSNTFRQIMLNETFLRLQSASREIQSNVTVISETRHTIFSVTKGLNRPYDELHCKPMISL